MSQTHTLGKTATTVTRKDGVLRVVYHSTEVVRVDADGVITLDTGGWKTVTTKTRMNQAANQFGLGYLVHQENFDWFVRIPQGDGDNRWRNALIIPFNGREITFNPLAMQVAA